MFYGRGDFRAWQDMIRAIKLDGVAGHLREKRILGFEDNRGPSSLFHGLQSGYPIIEHPTEKYGDHTLTVPTRCRAKQRVYRGAGAILAWSARDAKAVFRQHQVTVRRSDVDHRWL